MKRVCLILIIVLIMMQPCFADDYDMFMEHGSIMMIIDPVSGNIVYANLAAAEFYKYTVDELLSMNINDINTLTEEEIAKEMTLARVERRNFFNFIHKLGDLTVREVEVYSYPVVYQDKEMLFSIIIDVTESNQMERQLARNQQRQEENLLSIVYIAFILTITFIVLAIITLRSNRRLKYLSQYDPLTKVNNRSSAKGHYDKLVDKRKYPIQFYMIDVNNLKFINDTYGHIYGDQMIVEVADLLKNLFGKEGFVSRVSGDEFIVIVKMELEEAERIEKEILNTKIQIQGIHFDVSVGRYMIKGKVNYDTAFSISESRMYSVKVARRESTYRRIKYELLTRLKKSFPDKERHSRVVGEIASYIGHRHNLLKDEVSDLVLASKYQDISFGAMMSMENIEEVHPERSFSIINALGERYNVANTVLSHHEYYDGSGFPKGLRGKDIPLSSRILSISNYLYYEIQNKSSKEALDGLKNDRSNRYDFTIVKSINDENFISFLTDIYNKEFTE